MSDDASAARPPNRLIREKSPYLLQHAHNPVDWYPWGEEAFARARVERKPILLSIGYSTCHWCHVMERESFEDIAIAERLRRSFVAIKVDREERPDIDRLYMTAAQAMGLGGGWPLNLFLTPEAEPFYGGTYFPPEPRHGRPSFRQILESVERAWAEQPARIEESGRRVLEALAGLDRVAGSGSAAPRSEELFEEAYRHFEQTFDSRDGGFGSAPKFPTAVNLEFLLRVGTREPARAETALEMVARQLDAMRAGGIHDHLGGGFHRYSTDARWLVPHFEKMLYDQAQLASICLDAFQVTGRAEYAETSRGIFGYVMRDLSAGRPAGDGLGASGAFCSAEDADSEGEEGRFYVWTPGEVAAVLGGDEATLFDFVYGVSPAGNFERGAAILSLVRTNAEAARRFGLGEEEVARRLEADRARLLEARGRRVRPSRDDKVIASWNGLMISALARGARVLDDPSLAARAAEAA
ncbi:MAG TPA: thioredoxin domain-containing protein, partial [Terriglobales bacterium]|nr:thioredoxin domain-containing protein [Terriglobales bacterium]